MKSPVVGTSSSPFCKAAQLSKGLPHEDLKVPRATNELFAELIDYRHYRLSNTRQRSIAHARANIRSFCHKLDFTLKERKFDGSNGVLVFEFLRNLIRDANLAARGEAQLYLILPRMLKKAAYGHSLAIRDCCTAEGGRVTCWSEGVQYLLRPYAMPQAINYAAKGLLMSAKLSRRMKGTMQLEGPSRSENTEWFTPWTTGTPSILMVLRPLHVH